MTGEPLSNTPQLVKGVKTLLILALLVALGFAGSWVLQRFRESREASARAACFLNANNCQQAMRNYQIAHGLALGAPVDWDWIFGPDGYLKRPVCPSGGTYTFSKGVPDLDELACTCSHPGHSQPHYKEY